jgi:predicted ATPase
LESDLEWSYRLLADQEQQALRMLPVFRSSFRLAGGQTAITSAHRADEVMSLAAARSFIGYIDGATDTEPLPTETA